MKTSLLILCSIALVGCGSKATNTAYVPKPVKSVPKLTVSDSEAASLFPATVGNRWQYEVATQVVGGGRNVSQNAKYSFEMKKVEPIEGGNLLHLDLLNEDVLLMTQTWKVTTSGIYQVSVEQAGEKMVSVPDQLIAPFPIKTDSAKPVEIPWAGKSLTAVGMSTVTSKTVTEGPEIIDTKAGMISAYRFVTDSEVVGPKGEKGTMKTVCFFGPKVGLLRFLQIFKGENFSKTERMEILQYTVK